MCVGPAGLLPWLLRIRTRRATLKVGALALGLLLISSWNTNRRPSPPSAACLQIFRLSRWRRAGPAAAPATCGSGSLSQPAAVGCLRRRAARLGRPARLVLVGDSRSRILQEQLRTFLRLDNGSEPADVRPSDVPDGAFHSLEVASTRDMCQKRDKFCSRVVDSELVRLEFWRRPFVLTLFVRKLWELVDQCRRRQPSCPDVVVLNSAIWYCRKVWMTQAIHKSVTFWMLKLREDMDNLKEVLTALTMETTVVWRLEEAITSDVTNLLRKLEYQKRLSVSHAFAYDLSEQVDGLVVWSSMLAETFDFAQRVCGPVKHLKESDDPAMEEIFDQCDDEIHVGTTMRQRFVSMLLDVLCEIDGVREMGHCCRS